MTLFIGFSTLLAGPNLTLLGASFFQNEKATSTFEWNVIAQYAKSCTEISGQSVESVSRIATAALRTLQTRNRVLVIRVEVIL